jgi:signal transduction histidine kinase
MPASSKHPTHAGAEGVGGLWVDAGDRATPGVRRLALVAVVVGGGISLQMADSLGGLTGWLVGLVVLSVAIAVGRRPPEIAEHGRLRIERTAGGPVALVLENARLEAELRAMTDKLRRTRARAFEAAAGERHRMERELHDRAQNRLVGLRIRLALAEEQAEASAPNVARLLAELGDETNAVSDELRHISRGIYPAVLATHGLAEALIAEARHSAVAVRIDAGSIESSTPAVELAVYLCCLEAMQNAAKHGGRDVHVTVCLRREGNSLAFSVKDDGCGFLTATAEGSGLVGMRDRIARLAGRLTVSSVLGQGTVVAGSVLWPPKTNDSGAASEPSGG